MGENDIVVRVVKAVAAADGVDTTELEPLYTYIDPGMLEEIAEREKGEWCFSFKYADHRVRITHDERIFVDGEVYYSDEVTL